MWGRTCSTPKWWERWRRATSYTWQSVLLFDEEYRQRQAKQGFPWGTDAPHLGTVMLRDRGPQLAPQQKKATTGGNANRSRPIGPSGKELCLQFNRGTCHYGTRCQYEHLWQQRSRGLLPSGHVACISRGEDRQQEAAMPRTQCSRHVAPR